MKKLLLACFLVTFSFCKVEAQKTLSKKEKKELKKKQKIEELESALFSAQVRFVANKMLPSSGNYTSARGGILFLRQDKGEFMEYLWVDRNNKKTLISTEFEIDSINKIGDLNNSEIVLNFTGNVKGTTWYFRLTVEPSGKSQMLIKTDQESVNYDGRISKL